MMLAVQDVSKHFGTTTVNDAVSFHIEKGEVFGLLGPNGAGKTTLVSQIIGFMKPTTGSITIDQADVVKRPHIARKLCTLDRKSTRLNSSHVAISYAVFCLKKKI